MAIWAAVLFSAGLIAEFVYISLLQQLGFALNTLWGASVAIVPPVAAIIVGVKRIGIQRSLALASAGVLLVLTASLILI